jgi:hypothetical protein
MDYEVCPANGITGIDFHPLNVKVSNMQID